MGPLVIYGYIRAYLGLYPGPGPRAWIWAKYRYLGYMGLYGGPRPICPIYGPRLARAYIIGPYTGI